MSEITHYPHTPTGLINAYVAARVAQYDRVNKLVMDQYANDIRHYKDGADMDRPVPPHLILYNKAWIREAFSKFEDLLTIWAVQPTDDMPQIFDEVLLAISKNLLEGFEREEPTFTADEDDSPTVTKSASTKPKKSKGK